ncbi:hypothetical protein [Pseudomonas fluorescens]|uniref:hypothetical protein n=1 Tax=Pseudomonas fluorescens TaxID=294 RepID=UPI001780C1BD|nr:hypothetical protein [Pseudomonas fluorescens]
MLHTRTALHCTALHCMGEEPSEQLHIEVKASMLQACASGTRPATATVMPSVRR